MQINNRPHTHTTIALLSSFAAGAYLLSRTAANNLSQLAWQLLKTLGIGISVYITGCVAIKFLATEQPLRPLRPLSNEKTRVLQTFRQMTGFESGSIYESMILQTRDTYAANVAAAFCQLHQDGLLNEDTAKAVSIDDGKRCENLLKAIKGLNESSCLDRNTLNAIQIRNGRDAIMIAAAIASLAQQKILINNDILSALLADEAKHVEEMAAVIGILSKHEILNEKILKAISSDVNHASQILEGLVELKDKKLLREDTWPAILIDDGRHAGEMILAIGWLSANEILSKETLEALSIDNGKRIKKIVKAIETLMESNLVRVETLKAILVERGMYAEEIASGICTLSVPKGQLAFSVKEIVDAILTKDVGRARKLRELLVNFFRTPPNNPFKKKFYKEEALRFLVREFPTSVGCGSDKAGSVRTLGSNEPNNPSPKLDSDITEVD